MLNMIIDAHTHVFSPRMIAEREGYCSSDVCFGLLYSNPAAKMHSSEDLIRSMDENGIQQSVIQNIGWVNHDACLRSNDYILESVARYPGRLAGFCAVQPLELEASLNEIARCGRGGAKGIGELRPDVQGYDLCNLDIMKPLMAEIERQCMAVSLHASEPAGHSYAGKGNTTPGILYDFISSFRGINIILAHFGGGLLFYELMPEVRETLIHTYYDTAAAPFLYNTDIYKIALQIAGPGKLLFGSDWPLLAPQRVLEHIRAACLEQADLDCILGGNAKRLFNSGGVNKRHGR